ncbi:hypothetical protein V8F06_007425 [Rhypophila decipiens]
MSADDLIALLDRNLTLEPVRSVGQVAVPGAEPKIIYASMHYNPPTAVNHLVSSPAPVPKIDYTEVLQYLQHHTIDTSGLSDAQLELFKNVSEPQRMELLQFWGIAPPKKGATPEFTTTSVEQERTLANLRWEQMQEDEAMAQLQAEASAAIAQQQLESDTVMSQDSNPPLTPVSVSVQLNDSSWIQTSPINYMEPYMMSGYEEMARREYEESARNEILAERVAQIKDLGNARPTTTAPGVGIRTTFNQSHSDPVYNMGMGAISNGGFMTVADWRRRQDQEAEMARHRQQQQEEMANQYGRLSSSW